MTSNVATGSSAVVAGAAGRRRGGKGDPVVDVGHAAFTFTPAVSLFVECADEAELDEAYAKLSEDGAVLMPLGNHGFSRKFGWVNDRFGVSWQLNLT